MESSITPPTEYPGNHQHRRLLQAITEYCARQPWALALIVFGSLARGDWDAYSDLDLDVVIADEATIAPLAEVERMCAAIGEHIMLVASRRGDDADGVLASLAALEEVRDNLMTLYIRTYGGERPLTDFERRAEPELQDALAGTLASYDVLSIRAGLLAACDLLEQRLPAFCDQRVELTDGERALLTQTRVRLTGDGA